MRFAVVLLAFVALAFAGRLGANPSQPTVRPPFLQDDELSLTSSQQWPAQFSASVLESDDSTGQMRFFRWFYSQTLNKDRFDGPVQWQDETYFSEVIFDHVAELQYDVFMQPDEVVCFSHAINTTIPKPNLSSMTYIGKALINDDPVYHWFQQDTANNMTFQYYDDQTSRDPVRIDFAKGNNLAVTWLFWEFDDDAQDPSLYSLSSTILAQCNPSKK